VPGHGAILCRDLTASPARARTHATDFIGPTDTSACFAPHPP
jgi:hypothetical protein